MTQQPQQRQWGKDDAGDASAFGSLQSRHQIAVRARQEPRLRERTAEGISAEALEGGALEGLERSAGVEMEPVEAAPKGGIGRSSVRFGDLDAYFAGFQAMRLMGSAVLCGLLAAVATPTRAYGSVVKTEDGYLVISPDGPRAEPSPLHLHKVEISDALDEIAQRLGRGFRIRQCVHGTLTMLSETPLSWEDTLNALTLTLEMNNIRLYRSGQYYALGGDIVCGDALASRPHGYTYHPPPGPVRIDPELVTEVIALKHIEANTTKFIAFFMVSRRGYVIDLPARRIVLSEVSRESIERVKKPLVTLDQGTSYEVFLCFVTPKGKAPELAQRLSENTSESVVVIDRSDVVIIGTRATETTRIERLVQESGIEAKLSQSLVNGESPF